MIPVAGILSLGTKLIDRLIPDKTEAAKAKLALVEMEQRGEMAELQEAASIIRAEAESGSWLACNWRPITMLTFVALIVAHWLGFTAENIEEVEIIMLLEIVKIGLGGYVMGRSAEKVMKEYKK